MQCLIVRGRALLLALVGVFAFQAVGQNLTVQVGSTAPPPTPIVSRNDVWRWHKGTNAPVVGWQTNSDASLGSQWLTGPGGFGYSTDTAGETNNCLTILTDMQNNYRTLYIRREFNIASPVDTNATLRLTMDYDDAFVAYLDGVEIRRGGAWVGSANVGVEPAHTNLATSSHESSLGSGGNAPTVYNLGAVSNRLDVGTHYLGIIGLNGTTAGSTDLILVPDLALVSTTAGSAQNGTLLTILSGTTAILSGSNSVAGATRVSVNGDDAVFNAGTGQWSKTNALVHGLNRVFIAALDTNGNLFASTNRVIIAETNSTSLSGTLSGSNYWSGAMGIIRVTATITIPAGSSLTIAPGTVVLLSAGAGITVNGTLTAIGTAASPIFFGPANGTSEWGVINAAASGASVTLKEVETAAGRVNLVGGSTMLIEDTVMHHFYGGSMLAGSGGNFTIRRSHLHHFHDSNINSGNVLAEDMLVEDCDSTDGDPFEMSNATGAQIRRFTLRRSTGNNADAFDCNSVNNATFEDCLIHTVSDKGISIGTAGGPASQNVVIRNCLIYNTRNGIAFKDDSRASVSNVTIANSLYGIQLYPKYTTNTINAGGRVTNFVNNLLWNNGTPITITNGFINVTYSDISGTNWPGTGNISADPLFVNAAAGDFRLGVGSPALGTGAGGGNMGFNGPVGGLPGAPLNFAAISSGTNAVQLVWRDDADNEAGFHIERSTDASTWSAIASVSENVTNYVDLSGVAGVKYYYRVAATNGSGASDLSNIASARRKGLVVISGGSISGTITEDTLIAPGASVVVSGTLTVNSGVTFSLGAGATLLFNQGLNFVVNGSLIAEGTASNHVIFKPNAGATTWGTLDLLGAASSHRLVWCDILNSSGNIDATSTTIWLEHIGWTNSAAALSQLVDCVGSSITLLDSYIPGGAGVEPVHFSSMPASGHALIRGNVFAAPQGYNDSVDFTGGNRPGPIVQFIDNVFLAAVDDCFDMDGTDAHIEGNIFLNVHQDAVRDSTANAVSTGADSGNQSELVVVRNIFYNCDHALLIKDLGSMVFDNNTVVTIQTNAPARTPAAYIQFGEPHRTVPGGRGLVMNGNILWDLRSSTPFIYFTNGTMFMAANYNTIDATNITSGISNNTVNPMFVNWQTGITAQNIKSNLALLAGSPARGTGPNGLDRGALVPSGASISGEPIGTTTNRNATLKISGPGMYAYKWKLNNGPWSTEVALTNTFTITATMFDSAAPVALSNLADGSYTVYVIGKNSAGYWQDTNAATVSKTWTVSTNQDSDGDGIPDEWELAYGLNKDVAGDAALDNDNDGLSNLQEYQAGTNPTNSASRLAIELPAPIAPGLTFQFPAVSNKSYTIEYRNSLTTGAWARLQDVPPLGSNAAVTITNSSPDPMRFYRVRTPMLP